MFDNTERRLLWAIAVTILILLGEGIGGLLSNSLALMSDAGHVLTDTFALTLSLFASIMTHRPADKRATYGYHRVGVLAASINGIILVGMAIFIFMEAYRRFISPPEVRTGLMLIIASIGLAGNLLMAWFLHGEQHDLNLKSAWLHVISDTLASVGVIVSGVIILMTGWRIADPIAGMIVGLLVITGGARVLRDALRIFLDIVPHGFDIEDISREISDLEGVIGIHDVHVWSIGHGTMAFSAHLLVHNQDLSSADGIRKAVEHRLEHMGIRHTVLQLECAECSNEGLFCQIRPGISAHTH